MNTEGLDALNYSLALVKVLSSLFLKFGHGYAIQWGKQCILDCIPKYQQSVIPPGVERDLSMLFVCLPAALHHIFRPSRSALMENA